MKLAKSKLEDARIAVRSTRDDAMKQIEKSEKASSDGNSHLNAFIAGLADAKRIIKERYGVMIRWDTR